MHGDDDFELRRADLADAPLGGRPAREYEINPHGGSNESPLRRLIQERVMDRHPQNPQNRGFEGFEGSAGAKKDIYLKKGRKGGVLRDSPSPHRSQLGRRARVTAATGAEAENCADDKGSESQTILVISAPSAKLAIRR